MGFKGRVWERAGNYMPLHLTQSHTPHLTQSPWQELALAETNSRKFFHPWFLRELRERFQSRGVFLIRERYLKFAFVYHPRMILRRDDLGVASIL
jgi:hypothetical protein